MTSARKLPTKPVLCTLLALIALFGLGLLDPDRAVASCSQTTCSGKDASTGNAQTWRAMEDFHSAGKSKAIGV